MANGKAAAVRLNEVDTVAVLTEDAAAGDELYFVGVDVPTGVTVKERVPYGHKVAIKPMREGQAVIKYGEAMGVATAAIAIGYHVHTHNVRGLESDERESLGGAVVA